MPDAKKPDDRQFKVGDKIRVNLYHGNTQAGPQKADGCTSVPMQETDSTFGASGFRKACQSK